MPRTDTLTVTCSLSPSGRIWYARGAVGPLISLVPSLSVEDEERVTHECDTSWDPMARRRCAGSPTHWQNSRPSPTIPGLTFPAPDCAWNAVIALTPAWGTTSLIAEYEEAMLPGYGTI